MSRVDSPKRVSLPGKQDSQVQYPGPNPIHGLREMLPCCYRIGNGPKAHVSGGEHHQASDHFGLAMMAGKEEMGFH